MPIRLLVSVVCAHLALFCTTAHAIDVKFLYFQQQVIAPPTLSNIDPLPEDLGIAGARLGLADNLTTGSFLGHTYTLEVVSVAEGDDVISAAKTALGSAGLVILDAPATTQLQIADLPEAASALLLNASSGANSLRDTECRANLLHTVPSLAMRTDALMQFLQKKRWTDLALIEGRLDGDAAYAEALLQSARKFGLRIRARDVWTFDADMRRNAAREVPLFTQGLGDYDVLLVADENHDFGRYVLYNTWRPRPVAGSEGVSPVAWSDVVEQWGAAQLQSRFEDQASRTMRPRDYAAWAAVRSVGEAVTRTNSADIPTLRDYLLSDGFELAGFKGRAMTFRGWNGQLRQPIPLVQPRAVVAQAPLEGFLHQRTELDTLGLDEPESGCSQF